MNIKRNKGLVTLPVLGILVCIGILITFGYVISISVIAGVGGGSFAAWLCNGVRRYSNYHIDVRDTD